MQCCVVEEGERCLYPATPSATFNRKLLKNVSQKRQRYSSDPEVSTVAIVVCPLLSVLTKLMENVQSFAKAGSSAASRKFCFGVL